MSRSSDGTTNQLLFQPIPFLTELHNSFHNIPRYLFRLYSPHTAGTTTLSEVTSPAWRLSYPSGQQRKRDLFQNKYEDAGRLLHEHLEWDSQHESTCNLMSWTSSLLVAIQYGLFRNGQKFVHLRSKLKDIFILVIDTSEFAPGVFMRDLEAIDALNSAWKPLDQIRGLRTRPNRRMYFGEYLTQGRLDVQGKCVQTSLEKLINSGLFDLVPELQDKLYWHQWAIRVVNLREIFDSGPLSNVGDKKHVRRAIAIAETCFGGSWTLPMTLMLLSIKSRWSQIPAIVGGVAALFTEDEIKDGLRNLNIDESNSEGLPEVMQVAHLVDHLHTEIARLSYGLDEDELYSTLLTQFEEQTLSD